MTLRDIINEVSTNRWFWATIILTLVEISPIKINPLGALFKAIGKKTTAEVNKKLDGLKEDFSYRENELRKSHEVLATSFSDLQAEIHMVKREFEIKNANDSRWEILDFANSCRNGRKHGREEWEHVIDQLKCYETYVTEHKIDNGVIEEDTRYLRELYRERCKRNDFL